MRKVHLVVGSAVLGIVGLIFLLGNVVEVRVEIRARPRPALEPTAIAPTGDRQLSDQSPASRAILGGYGSAVSADPSRRMVDQAAKLAAAGQTREAQELYLQILAMDPDHREAMRGLVRVRRVLAGDDPRMLRKQAEAFREAVSKTVDTGQPATAHAMDLLATADLIAAAELEDQTAAGRVVIPPPRPAARPAVSQPKPEPAIRPQPVRPALQTTRKPRKASSDLRRRPRRERGDSVRRDRLILRSGPTPIAPRPGRQNPQASTSQQVQKPDVAVDAPALDANEPFATITVGPIHSGARASSITTELTVAGYVARMRRGGAAYVITMGPYRRSVAERIASRIRSRFREGVFVSSN
jgi:hypothetical protein